MKLIKNTWDEYYLTQLNHVKTKSKDPSTKVGAIIVGKINQIVTSGFNGFAINVKDDPLLFPERYERPLKYNLTIHAELNSILLASRSGTRLEGCKIYTSLFPCIACANAIIQAGLIEIITFEAPKVGTSLADRWDFDLPRTVLTEAGVRITEYEQ